MAEHVRNLESRRRSGGAGVAAVGVVGELLITAAIVLGLFAFWQLYWTSWQVEGPRDQAVQQFEQDNPASSRTVGERHTDAPPVIDQPADGALYGVIHVPSWDWMKIPLAEGTSDQVLDQAFAGHYSETAQVGEIGNFSVAAHRRTYGNNFRHIDRLVAGDKVIVETADTYYVYTVDNHEIVSPDAAWVIAPVIGDQTFSQVPTERWMTMTTCHPEYGNSERYIVHLRFESWTPKDTGVPQELADEPAS
ncbi:class E sortase [Schaalia naturae]|jgi:sortase A|uniref:Class E sortase n=1 Tax=Schaalia naturae TaxID=635203 RepID=A0ABW2SP49_9ACTO